MLLGVEIAAGLGANCARAGGRCSAAGSAWPRRNSSFRQCSFSADRSEPTREAVSYAGIWRKVDLLFNVFDNYNRAFDVTCFVSFLGLFGGLVWNQRLRLDAPRLGCACGIVFAAYLLLPSQMYGGSGADRRLPIALFLLFDRRGSCRAFRAGASLPRSGSQQQRC